MSTLHLSCSADRRYIGHAAAMLHSVLVHRGETEVQVHYLHGPWLHRRIRRRLSGMVEDLGGAIEFLQIPDERIAGLPTFEDVTRARWYRIYLPDLLPDLDRVLYLDADTLAVESLAPLWGEALGDCLVGAVTNVFTLDPAARALPAALGLSRLDDYFNSGVLLLNLEEMRRDGTSAKLRDYALSNELMYQDQDAFNAVMSGRRLNLHPRWNYMNSFSFPYAGDVLGERELEEARRKPGIRHFEGPGTNKPWHRGCSHDLRELYFEHRRATPWPRVRMEGARRPAKGTRRGWSRTAQP